METSFELLGLTGYRLGLCAAIGVLALYAAMLLLGKKRGIDPASVSVLAIIAMVCGLVMARVFYCLVNLSDFIEAYENPWLMLRFFDGGLSVAGLLCGMLLALPVAAAVTGKKCSELADILCVPMGLLFCALYLGQQDTGLGIGEIVEENAVTGMFPWLFLCERMGVNVEYRMLVYLYQAIASVVITLIMVPLYLGAQRKQGFRSGEAALVSLALYGAVMIVMESLRDDGHMLIIFLRIGQVVAALLLLIALIVLSKRLRKQAGRTSALCWFARVMAVLLVVGIVVLEFALDGRLAVLEASNGFYYAVMILLCALAAAVVLALQGAVRKARAA